MVELYAQKAITGDDDDNLFGYSVAISGNYCIVGDYQFNTVDTGHTFIYERQRNGEWKQVKALTGDTNDAQFGISVAISGNYCIVGDYQSQRGTAGKGHAFIYERQRNGDWKQVKALTGDADDELFGRSVAISGNYCIVGDDQINTGTGHAFIYERQRNGEWKQVKALTGDADDVAFGRSVAISGNYCIVGDHQSQRGDTTDKGHAFIYERQRNGEWKQVKALTGDADDDSFGFSVAISGNYCIVGDHQSQRGDTTDKGHAFIYERQRNGEWKQVKALTGDADDDSFGFSVAISGNYCIVGDYEGDGGQGGANPGHAFIYERQRNGDWKQVKALTGDANDDNFGDSVAISGNYCIVGDNNGKGAGTATGHAFIYELKLV